MKDKDGDYRIVELEDDELAEVNGGIGISDVSGGSDGCQNFFRAAGAGMGNACGNCFYFHRENGRTYCSHPHFGKK